MNDRSRSGPGLATISEDVAPPERANASSKKAAPLVAEQEVGPRGTGASSSHPPGEGEGGSVARFTMVLPPSVRRVAPTSLGSGRLYQRRRCHPFDVAKWRRRVGGVSVRTVLDVAQSAYVRNNVPADQRRCRRQIERRIARDRGTALQLRACETRFLLPVTLHVADARYYHPPPPVYGGAKSSA